jgi:citrate synthase
MVGSSHAGLFASISAGFCTLRDHYTVAQIKQFGNVRRNSEKQCDADKYLAAKDKDDPFRLMGFGHEFTKL